MNKLTLFLILGVLGLAAWATDDEHEEYEIYKQARGHWFSEEWAEAITDFQRLIERYPNSSRRCKCESFVGYSYAKLGERRLAIDTFTRIARSTDCKEDIINDAKSERLQLAFELYEENPAMKQILVEGIGDANDDIRFIAAVFLAQLDDPSGLEVFFDVVKNDPDQDRRDTAYRHILKLGNETDKERLEEIVAAREASGEVPKMIKLVIRNVASNEIEHKVQLPIRLFNVIIRMLREEQMDLINEEYNIDLRNLEIDLEKMKPGTVLFQIVDGDGNEIKITVH